MKSLETIYESQAAENYIEPALYSQFEVKQGLRNENGTGVKVGLTKICDVRGYKMHNGQKEAVDGELIYRGYSINDLADNLSSSQLSGYEQTAFLLIFGRLPDPQELEIFSYYLKHSFNADLIDETYQSTNLLNALQIEVLKLYASDPAPDTDDLNHRMMKGISILSSLPLFIFSIANHHKYPLYPLPAGGFAENILWMARNNQPYSAQEARIVDLMLMVHADHGGGNNSTFANVVISSTGTDIYSCIAAAIGSLKGPKHGGAAVKMSEQTQNLLRSVPLDATREELKELCRKILKGEWGDGSGLIYGIGHAIYTKSDPRCQIIKKESRNLAKEKGQLETFELLSRFEEAAVEVMKEQKGVDVCANVDFYSGFAYYLLGIDPSLFTALFAIARCAGWIAHHLENRQSNRKLIRPANVYVGRMNPEFDQPFKESEKTLSKSQKLS